MKKSVLLISILAVSINVFAGDEEGFRKKEINFIRELYKSGRYFDCIAETGKLQQSVNNPSIEYFKYSNYYLAGQYTTVLHNYSEDHSSENMLFASSLLIAESYFKKGLYAESYETLTGLDFNKIPDKYKFTLFLRRVEPLVLSGLPEKINNEIASSEIILKDNYNFIKLREELQQYNNDGLKSSGFAALMSAVVPGLGQCYAGYPGEGIISLLAVASTAAGGIYMKEHGRKSFSYSLLFFSGLFYGGNIYGAYNSAETANEKVLLMRYKKINSKYGSYKPGEYIDFERVFN